MSDIEQGWKRVRQALRQAKGIAWDGCHKIYVLMDDDEVALMRSYDYDPLLLVADLGVEKAYETVKGWWEESCGLRFVNSVATVEGNPNDGFMDLIGQFEFEDA